MIGAQRYALQKMQNAHYSSVKVTTPPAWFALFTLGAVIPLAAVIGFFMARNQPLEIFETLVEFGIILMIALAIFVTTLGYAVFSRRDMTPWQWIGGISITLLLILAISLTLYFVNPVSGQAAPTVQSGQSSQTGTGQPTSPGPSTSGQTPPASTPPRISQPEHQTVCAIQVMILLGVLGYCAVIAFEMDQQSDSDVQRMIAETKEQYGTPDAFIKNYKQELNELSKSQTAAADKQHRIRKQCRELEDDFKKFWDNFEDVVDTDDSY